MAAIYIYFRALLDVCEKVSVSYLKRQRDSVCMGRIEENECKSVFVWI